MRSEFAPGLPRKGLFKDFPTITRPENWVLVCQEHRAKRAGPHIDLRLFKPGSGIAFSWALRSLPSRGQKVLATEQSLHTEDYAKLKTLTIPEGYGAGTVKQLFSYPIDITNANPDKINIHVLKGKEVEQLTLVRINKKAWLLVNHTEAAPTVPKRPIYKELNPKKLDIKSPGKLWQPKLDGASASIHLTAGKLPRVFSFRTSKKTGLPIEYTYKIPGFIIAKTPASLQNTIIRGEIFGHSKKTGKPLDAPKIGGMLNSNILKSRKLQNEHGALKVQVFDVKQFRGKDVSNSSYKDKLRILNEVAKHIPVSVPKTAITQATKKKLLESIMAGSHPDTKEGIVEWDLEEAHPPIKGKLEKEWDVYIRDVSRGQGGLARKSMAGAFWYSHEPTGPIVGKENIPAPTLRKDAWKEKKIYLGRVMRVSGAELHPSGAVRKPVLKGFHLDKNPPSFLKRMKDLNT